jgi:processive 1,2-diacylglycerol beta-glucosyltransferase
MRYSVDDFPMASAKGNGLSSARSGQRLLTLSVSAGAGHKRAAEAICAHASLSEFGIVAAHLDVMDHVTAGFRKLYTDFYIALVSRHPALWGYLYRVTDEALPDSVLQKLRRAIERLNTRSLVQAIRAFNPDAIVCTHFLPAEILAHLARKARISCPVWVQVTDFDLHRMWVQPGMTGYFAANEEVAFRMKAHGIAADAIHVTGIPVMPAFGRALDRRSCAHELGLDPDRNTVLLMGGGAGLGNLDRVATRLLALDAGLQLIVLAGKNADTLAALHALEPSCRGRLVAHAYTDRIERLMACADMAVTKPGGLTTSECLAFGLPMILNAPIPGQEERNADFLLEQGVALKANDATTLEYRIRYLLQHPEKLADMRRRALALGRPQAAQQVLNAVLQRFVS